MKTILAALAPLSATAFAPHALSPTAQGQASVLGVSSGGNEWSENDFSSFDLEPPPPPPPRKQVVMSPAIPFLECPPALVDCTMAGNVGFDPLGFAKTKEDLEVMREAEIRHSRLAMLVRLLLF